MKRKMFVAKMAAYVLSGALCLISLTGVTAKAAGREIYIDRIEASSDGCTLLVNQNQESVFRPSPQESQLSVDGQEYPISQIQMLSDTDESISYICMIDVSGSMSQEGVENAKKIIGQMADGKKTGDDICVTFMGNELVSSGFLNDASAVKSYVAAAKVTNEDTNLYASIKEELATLQGKTVHSKRYLIIFSDGADDQTKGITREEAETAVKESGIPIFTVAMLQDDPTEAQMDAAKVLGSFARYSAGGQHFAPPVDGYAYDDVYGKLQGYINQSLVVTADVSGIDSRKTEVTFSLKLSDGSETVRTEYLVKTADIGELLGQEEATEEAALEPTEEVVPEPTEEPAPQEEKPNLLPFVIGGMVVVAVVIIVAVAASRKKKDGEEESLAEDLALRKVVKITLRCMNPPQDYDLTLRNEIKIGRGRRCQLCIAEDAALSEVHSSLHLRQGVIYVVDENSTNGTYVNGVPIVGEYQLEPRDIIMMGSHEYQIFWK